MAKFKYRMQNILDIKMKLESQAKIAYGNANLRYLQEQEKLKDTEYCYAVNPNYSVNERSHFDILSFTPDGDFIYIEVKGSKGGLEEPFFMSTAELAFLEECMIQGLNYELHRVIYAKDPEKRKRIIYTPKEVLENYIYEPSNYLFRLKEEVL